MKFVLPYTKSRQRENAAITEETNGPHIHNVQKIEIDDYDVEKITEPETSPAMGIQAVMGNNSKKDIITPARFVFVPPICSTPNIAVKRAATVLEHEADHGNAPSETKLKAPPPDAIVIKEIEDADLSFFKSLLPDIRQMTPTQKRKFKIGIFELINNIVD